MNYNEIADFQRRNPDRYCKLEKYVTGYVCFIDILGFSDCSMDESKYLKIRNLFNSFLYYQINEELNENELKISIASDSILITVEEYNEQSLKILIRSVLFIRRRVIEALNVEIRAGITFGKYLHHGYKGQMYFGPAITRAVMISEKQRDVCCKYGDSKSPAGIFLDKNLFEVINGSPLNYIFNFEKYISKMNNENYVLNTYMYECYSQSAVYEQMIKHGDAFNEHEFWLDYIKIQDKLIEDNSTISEKIRNKYNFYRKMLNEFRDYIANNYVSNV